MNYIGYAPEYIVLIAILIITALIIKSRILLIISVIFTFCIIWFFQGALSLPTKFDPRTLYCPCDGIVSKIIEKDGRIQISVFLNVHNTHVQYSPFECTVKSIAHKDGTFHPAYLFEKSQYNERTEYILNNKYFGDVLFIQIAGQLARSIVSFVNAPQTVKPMEPIGLIKLGSRCDVYVNNKAMVLVREGDRVQIGDSLVRIG